jgi:calcium binding protein 39
MNKQRLLKFLPRFLEDRTDDDQFNDEKAWLIKSIGNLPDTTAELRTSNATTSPAGGISSSQPNPGAQVRS